MTLTKAQLAILAEMARTGEPLRLHPGGGWHVGAKLTTATLMRALRDAGFIVPERAAYEAPRILTDAGLREAEYELRCKGLTPHGWVRFGDVARERCGQQAQYASRAIDGRLGYPNLGVGLRFKGDPRDYHRVLIHADDVEEFVRRWKAHENV